MLSQYLQEKNPELIERARVAGVEVDTASRLEIFKRSPAAAELALQRAINLEMAQDRREALLEQFKQDYADEINAAVEAHEALLDAVIDFTESTGLVIVIDYDLEDSPVRIGRAKYGSKSPKARDLKAFGKALDKAGLSRQLRLSLGEDIPYVYAELQKDGSIKAGGNSYDQLKEWVSAERQKAFEQGLIQYTTGSPWKSVQVQSNKRGDYETIDFMYKRLMSNK